MEIPGMGKNRGLTAEKKWGTFGKNLLSSLIMIIVFDPIPTFALNAVRAVVDRFGRSPI